MTEKLQLLYRPTEPTSHAHFNERVRDELPRVIEANASAELSCTLAEPPPRWSVVPFDRSPLALVSLLGERPEAVPRGMRVDAYRVETSAPLEGTRRVRLLTLFRRREGLDDQRFVERWHRGHTPLAIEVHPLEGYVRNVVQDSLGDAEPLDGIVEEHVASVEDVVDPRRFFGRGKLGEAVINMAKVGWDVRGFIDLGSVKNYLLEGIG